MRGFSMVARHFADTCKTLCEHFARHYEANVGISDEIGRRVNCWGSSEAIIDGIDGVLVQELKLSWRWRGRSSPVSTALKIIDDTSDREKSGFNLRALFSHRINIFTSSISLAILSNRLRGRAKRASTSDRTNDPSPAKRYSTNSTTGIPYQDGTSSRIVGEISKSSEDIHPHKIEIHPNHTRHPKTSTKVTKIFGIAKLAHFHAIAKRLRAKGISNRETVKTIDMNTRNTAHASELQELDSILSINLSQRIEETVLFTFFTTFVATLFWFSMIEKIKE